MRLRGTLVALCVLGMLGVGATAQAAPITGSFTILTVLTAVDGETGSATSLGSATGIDFGFNSFMVVGAADDFAPLLGTLGTIKDFSFAGAGSAAFPKPPLEAFESLLLGTLTFKLLDIAVEDQNNSALHLVGSGLFSWAGTQFDPTPGEFNLYATGNGISLAFNATDTPTPVPEPGSLMLLGTGIAAGVGAMRRRGLLRGLAK